MVATIAGYRHGTAPRAERLADAERPRGGYQAVEIPAGGRASVEFNSPEVPYGRNNGEVRIDSADALPDDDRFYFAVERADPRRALFVQEARSSAAALLQRPRSKPPRAGRL